MKTAIIISVLALMFLVGCGNDADTALARRTNGEIRKEVPRKPTDKRRIVVGNTAWDSLSNGVVVAVWRNNKLTKADFNRHVDFMSALIRNRRPKISDDKLEKLVKKQFPKVKDELLTRLMLLNGLALTNTEAEVVATRKEIEKRYAKTFCSKGQDFDGLCKAMEGQGHLKLLQQRIEEDARIETALATTYAKRLRVTETEYSNTVERVAAYNRMAKATNDCNWVTATNVLKRLAAGEPFEKLADQYSQDPDKNPGGDMGECDASSLKFGPGTTDDFVKTPYWKAISSLKDGEHTDILETDVGLEIIKRHNYIAATNSNSGAPAVHLSRIYFRTPYIYPDQTEEDFRADLADEKRETFMKELFEQLQKKDKVFYPKGEAIFPKSKMQLPGKPM